MDLSRQDEFYCEDFEAPSPAEIEAIRQDRKPIFDWGGRTIVRLSDEVAVKYGRHVTLLEAKNMLFVAKNTSTMPVPKVFGYYSFGPYARDVNLYDTYIFMSLVDGETLEKGWTTYTEATKASIASQLKGYMTELRNIPSTGWIGSVDKGPLSNEYFLEQVEDKGPFDSEQDFNEALIKAYEGALPRSYVRSFLSAMLSEKAHTNHFTHGDFRPANIIVKDGKVAGIIDWELSGWYPEYWEFARAWSTWRFWNDWTDYLVDVLTPYFAEFGTYSHLSGHLMI